MKKIVILVLLVVVALGGMVFAQDNESVTLTPEQQGELDSLRDQMADLRLQMLDKMAEFDLISQERLEWMRQGQELWEAEGYGFQAPCHDEGRQRFGRRGGMMRGW